MLHSVASALCLILIQVQNSLPWLFLVVQELSLIWQPIASLLPFCTSLSGRRVSHQCVLSCLINHIFCFVRATVCCRVWGGWSVQCSGQAESAVGLQGLQHDSSECCLYWVGATGEGHMISVIFFKSKC